MAEAGSIPPPAAGWRNAWPLNVNKALLLVRVVVGGLFVGHGAQKLFGWFGGEGITGTIGTMEKIGAQPAPFWAYLEATTELVAGLMLAVGLLVPVAAAALVGDMVVAILRVHAPKAFWSQFGGWEYNLVLIALLVALGVVGAGRYALDRYLPLALPRPWTFMAALVVTGGLVALALFGLP